MPKYEIPNIVKDNILKLIARADIKGSEAPIIMEIFQCLATPIAEEKGKDKTNG